MSCLAQAGWATLMAAANPDQPVVFGATVSGRPANLDGVEAIVGLFINTIPICVHTNTQETTLEWLRSIHTKQADRERFSFIPLSQLNHLSSLPTRSPLFESVLVYENFPIEQQSSKNPETLSVSGVVVRERTSFPLTLIIGESDQWHLRLLFDENRISESAAKAILEGFSKIMESLFSYTDRPAIEFVRDHHALSDQTSLERSSFTHTTEAGEPVSITPPSTSFPSESILHEVWASVLGVSKIKPHDDFFDLGGDSILSLQIVSRLSKQGLKISVKDVFEHPTIHSLAKRLTSESTPLVDQDPVTGQIELSPIQHWFFSLQHENPSHWNQSLLFELADVLDEHALEQAIQKLIKHHDVLRGIFPTSSVKRPQTFTILESTDQHHLHRVNLEEGLSDNERAAQIQEHCDSAQQSLKIDQGQLIRFVFIKTGSATRDRLLIVSHHLVIDGVSWRILIDDLNLAYEQIARGRQTAALPPRTNSYKDWSLFTHSNSTKIAAVESSYWNSILSETMGQGTSSLTLREKSGDNREIDTIHQQEELTESETETLSHLAASGSLGNVENLLIAALAQAAFSTLPGKNLLIDLESHGRSNNECPLDLSRTIGWFTAIYPISLNRISEGGTLNYASHVHDRKQAIPQDGSGYGSLRFLEPESISDQVVFQSEILFNYLGRTSSQLSENAFFRPVDEPSGQTRSPITNRSHLLSVDCIIRNGRLRLDFGYSPQSTSEETMKRLMVNFIIAIREFASSDHSAPATLTPDTSMIEDDMLDDILDELED